MTSQQMQMKEALSPFYLKLIFFWFLTCGVVLIEPAPFDLIFFPVSFLILANHHIVLPRRSVVFLPCLVTFVATNILSILAADDLGRAFFYVAVTLYALMFASFIAVSIYNFGYVVIDKIMAAYVVVAVLSSVVGILAMLRLLPAGLIDIVTMYGETRARAFFKDPNVYAPFLMVALVYAIDKFFQHKAHKLKWGSAVFVLMFGILVGFSRGAWGASVVAVILYFLLSTAAERRMAQLGRYVAVLAFFALLSVSLFGVFSKEAKISSFVDQRLAMQGYDQDRFAVQGAAIALGADHIIGIGPGQSEGAFEGVSVNKTGSTHSLYVRVFIEQGIVGAVSFLLLLVLTAVKACRVSLVGIKEHRHLHCVFAASFLATLLNSVVIDTLHWRHFFLVMGCIWGLDMLDRARNPSNQNPVP